MIPVSFEFFPPKTPDQQAQLQSTVEALLPLSPDYVSVTFGAGGSTLDYTVETIRMLVKRFGLNAAPHLSCMGGTRSEIRAMLRTYQELGCKRIVALRGDMPSGMASMGEFRYASDLVQFIRAETGDYFHLEVAAYPEIHPQAESAAADLEHFIYKMRAGANAAITQYFFNADAYFRFVEEVRAKGCQAAIVPGIMPITNYSQLKRFSDVCGAEIPRWVLKRMQCLGDDVDAIRDFGLEVVTELCKRLIRGGAPGLHFYTLNRARASIAVCEQLGLRARSAAA